MIEAFRVGAVSRGGTLWDGLDLAFDDGEVCALVGPAACGKTTLLRILRGDRRPDAGDVVVGGESIFRGDPAAGRSFRAAVGIVPESFPADGGRTVGDLFRLSAVALGGVPPGERHEREEELLSMVGLPGAQGCALSCLSVSERARIALAVELFRGPKHLFADMLVMNAGGEWTEMLWGLFRALAREGRTVILAERILPERWRARGNGEGIAKGPFRLHRLSAPSGVPR